MTNDFYCDEVLSGNTQVEKVYETENVLAYYHTRPFYQVHIVAIPKKHIPSLTKLDDDNLLVELLNIVKKVARKLEMEHGACRLPRHYQSWCLSRIEALALAYCVGGKDLRIAEEEKDGRLRWICKDV